MKNIIEIIFSILLPMLSLTTSHPLKKVCKPKLCINCKHFITDGDTDKFGRCSLFPIKHENRDFLVNGIDEDKIIAYTYCSITRNHDDMCGVDGKMYTRKYRKKTV